MGNSNLEKPLIYRRFKKIYARDLFPHYWLRLTNLQVKILSFFLDNINKEGIHVTFLVKKLGMSRSNCLYALDELVGLQILSKEQLGRKGKVGRPIKFYRLENRPFVNHLMHALNELNRRLYGENWKDKAKEVFETHTLKDVEL